LLIFLFKQVDRRSLFEIIKSADKFILFLSFLAYFFVYVLCILRWDMLLKGSGIHIPIKRLIISFSGGIFFSLFLPSTIGGDLMRSIDLASYTKKTSQVVATVILDRLSGYIGLVIVALLSVVFGFRFIEDKSILLLVGIITATLIFILLVLFNKYLFSKINNLLHSSNAGKIREMITNLHQEMHIYRDRKVLIIKNLLLSLVIQFIIPVIFYITALSLGLELNIIYYLIFIPIIGAITMLPISIGGLGLRDYTTISFFAKVGVSKDLAFAMSLMNFSFILAWGIVGGIIYLLTTHVRRQKVRAA
jgi:uncharacterized protein (TIRG00374 family)